LPGGAQQQRARGRFRRAWRELKRQAPEERQAQDETRPRAHERNFRWLRRIDPGKPPLSVLRWLAVLGIALAWWAQGAATSPPHAWLPYVIIAGVLILPDVAGFAVGGLRVDMREAQEEIARLRQEVNAQARASSVAAIAVGDEAVARIVEPIIRATMQAISGQAGGAAVPWPPPDDSATQAAQSTASADGT
jgi:hypothetical protein